jgi:hypothetical protein
MVRTRVVTLFVAVFACCLAVVAIAFAGEDRERHWAGNGYHLESAQTGWLNHKTGLDESWGRGENRAVCSGIGSIGQTCVNRGETAYYTTYEGIYVESEPYLHNHDGEAGYFNGWYWGE